MPPTHIVRLVKAGKINTLTDSTKPPLSLVSFAGDPGHDYYNHDKRLLWIESKEAD